MQLHVFLIKRGRLPSFLRPGTLEVMRSVHLQCTSRPLWEPQLRTFLRSMARAAVMARFPVLGLSPVCPVVRGAVRTPCRPSRCSSLVHHLLSRPDGPAGTLLSRLKPAHIAR